MGGVAYGFVRPPPRLAAETMTTSGLRARQQAHAAALNNNDENEDDLRERG